LLFLKNSTALINALQAFENNQAIFYLTAGAVLISFSGVWVKLAHVTPTISGFYRVFFGGIFLLTAAFRQGEISWKGWRHLALGFTAGFFLSLDLFFWHSSIRYIGPGLATLLGNFQVFLLAAVGMLFMGEKLSLKFFFSILMAILGLFLIVGLQWNQVSPQYKIGVYFGLTTAVVYTRYIL
jgi:drug/metabolite transporter (DMT)-like permease